MSATLHLSGSLLTPSSTYLTTDADTVVFTASAKSPSRIVSVAVANPTASAVKVTLRWHDGTNGHVWWHREVAADDCEIIDFPLSLYSKIATQTMKAQAGTANAVTVTVIAAEDLSRVV